MHFYRTHHAPTHFVAGFILNWWTKFNSDGGRNAESRVERTYTKYFCPKPERCMVNNRLRRMLNLKVIHRLCFIFMAHRCALIKLIRSEVYRQNTESIIQETTKVGKNLSRRKRIIDDNFRHCWWAFLTNSANGSISLIWVRLTGVCTFLASVERS